jgi:hypothetical protein
MTSVHLTWGGSSAVSLTTPLTNDAELAAGYVMAPLAWTEDPWKWIGGSRSEVGKWVVTGGRSALILC